MPEPVHSSCEGSCRPTRYNPEGLELAKLEKEWSGGRLRLETGKYLLEKGHFDSAELCLDEVIAARPIDPPLLVETLIAKAELHRRKNAPAKARTCLDRGMECLATAPAATSLLGPLWKKRGDVELTCGCVELALDAYVKARAEFALHKLPDQEAIAALLAGGVAADLHRPEIALGQYRDVAPRSGTPEKLLVAGVGELFALTALHRTDEALEKCKELTQTITEAYAPRDQKRTLLRQVRETEAANHALHGDLAKACEVLKACLPIAPLEEQACELAMLAEWHFARGLAEDAALLADEVARLHRRLGTDIPSVSLSLARLELMRGNVRASEERFFEAQVEAPRKPGLGGMLEYELHELNLHTAKGEILAAESLASRLKERLASYEWKPLAYASVLNTLASIAKLRGAYEEAKGLYQKALDTADRLRAPVERARSLAGLAAVAQSEDADKALACMDEAIAAIAGLDFRLAEHAYEIERELISLRAEGNADAHLEHLSSLLVDGYQFQSAALDIQALLSLGILSWQEVEDPRTALSYVDDASSLADECGQTLMGILAQGLRGAVLQDLGESREAKDTLEEVLRQMEDLGLDIEARNEFRERYRDLGGFWLQGLR